MYESNAMHHTIFNCTLQYVGVWSNSRQLFAYVTTDFADKSWEIKRQQFFRMNVLQWYLKRIKKLTYHSNTTACCECCNQASHATWLFLTYLRVYNWLHIDQTYGLSYQTLWIYLHIKAYLIVDQQKLLNNLNVNWVALREIKFVPFDSS
jgi:hypothetical protein